MYQTVTLLMKFCNPKTPFTRYNLLSNEFDNWLYHVHKHPIGCQTGCTTGCSIVQQPVGQPAASCKHTSNQFLNCLYNQFDNRLYRINGV